MILIASLMQKSLWQLMGISTSWCLNLFKCAIESNVERVYCARICLSLDQPSIWQCKNKTLTVNCMQMRKCEFKCMKILEVVRQRFHWGVLYLSSYELPHTRDVWSPALRSVRADPVTQTFPLRRRPRHVSPLSKLLIVLVSSWTPFEFHGPM